MVVVALLLAGLVAWRWLARTPAQAEDQNRAGAEAGATPAAVAKVERKDLAETLTISGAFKPFQDVDVHAKVPGYIRRISVDVGDHVKEGQTIAELEIPALAARTRFVAADDFGPRYATTTSRTGTARPG